MSVDTPPNAPAVWWLRAGSSGTVEAISATGAVMPARLVPAELFDEDRDLSTPHEARLELDRQPGLRVVVWRPEGFRGVLAAIPGVESDVESVLETLVNQVAHDLRNFAFTIGLQAEMGTRRSASPDVLAHLTAVMRQVDALKGYLEDLLLYGRPPRLALRTVDVGAFLREAVTRFTFDRGTDAPAPFIHSRIAPDLGTAAWDAEKVERAIHELLDNAVRSATPSPAVTLAATAAADMLTVEIVDEGSGIPPELIARVRQPMAVRRAGGAGLGIPIAAKIARAHGGQLELSSSPAGTTVRLILPRGNHAG